MGQLQNNKNQQNQQSLSNQMKNSQAHQPQNQQLLINI